ncbi:MAG TPA: permease-like cell division protein FtsX [Luteibaculaceae bacterium]|nr:permease-like cell division protein FtsX [Luteibaculaceae bacterium]
MSASPDKISSATVRSSSASTVIGISLVLFMMGLLGLLLLNAKKLADYVRENLRVEVYLSPDASNADIAQLQQTFSGMAQIKQVLFISKAEAARKLQADLGEDFISFLGYNPLSNSFSLAVKAQSATPDQLAKLASTVSAVPLVTDVRYSRDLVTQINHNTRNIALVLLGFSVLLLLISIALINNTIRLSIYSQRFIIKTMQLVGAKTSFIRRPFLIKGTLNGLYAAFIASLLLAGVVYLGKQQFPDLFGMQDMVMYGQVFAGTVVLGIAIAWISTLLAVRKYIRLKTDEVY